MYVEVYGKYFVAALCEHDFPRHAADRLTTVAAQACEGDLNVSRNILGHEDVALNSAVDSFGLIVKTRLVVSACPTTDERLEIGTTPAVMQVKDRALCKTPTVIYSDAFWILWLE